MPFKVYRGLGTELKIARPRFKVINRFCTHQDDKIRFEERKTSGSCGSWRHFAKYITQKNQTGYRKIQRRLISMVSKSYRGHPTQFPSAQSTNNRKPTNPMLYFRGQHYKAKIQEEPYATFEFRLPQCPTSPQTPENGKYRIDSRDYTVAASVTA
jgi:hypothetical protein